MLLCIKLFINKCRLIRYNFLPLPRRNNSKFHRRFEIRLIKQCKYSIGIVWLKLRVNILLLININKTDTSTSIIIVSALVLDNNSIRSYFQSCNIKIQKSILMFDALFVLIFFIVDDHFLYLFC